MGNRLPTMELRYKWLGVLGLAITATGCTSITNYSTDHHVRNAAGQYPVEIGWSSNQRSVIPGSLRPVIQTGFNSATFREFPMTPSSEFNDRWTAMVPVPKGTNFFNYRVKVEFGYYKLAKKARDCRLSPPYQMQIIDP